jgi:hypothetical protein
MGVRLSRGTRLKAIAFLLLAVPATLLSLLVLWELSVGNSRAPGHAFEAVPLILATGAAFRWPRLAGAILLVVGLALLVLYPVQEWRQGRPWLEIAFVEAVIVTPPLLAGFLLRLATREER